MRERVASEALEQKWLFEWAAYNVWLHPELQLMFHVPNGGSRDVREAHNLKMQGVKAGVPDICLPIPRGQYHGMFIEMKKSKGGVVSQEQKGWLMRLNEQGYKAIVAHGFEEAKTAIEKYLRGY